MPRRFSSRTVIVTTDSGGNSTAFIPSPPDPLTPLDGEIRAIAYEANDFLATADFAITTDETGVGVWTQTNVPVADKTVHPIVPASNQAGVALTYDGAQPLSGGPPVLANERLKIVIAQGGDTRTGTFTVVYG